MKTIPPSATGPQVEIQSLQPTTNAGILAQPPSHDDVLAARPGQHGARLGQGDGPQQGVEPADDPDADEERRTGQLRRHVARGPEDADQDGVADEDRDAERDAQDPLETAPFHLRARAFISSVQFCTTISSFRSFGAVSWRKRNRLSSGLTSNEGTGLMLT